MTNEQATTRHILKCGKESDLRVCDRKRVNLTGCQWFVVVGCSRHQILARYKYNYMPGVRVAGAACSFTLNHWVEWCSLSLSLALWLCLSLNRSLAYTIHIWAENHNFNASRKWEWNEHRRYGIKSNPATWQMYRMCSPTKNIEHVNVLFYLVDQSAFNARARLPSCAHVISLSLLPSRFECLCAVVSFNSTFISSVLNQFTKRNRWRQSFWACDQC